MTANPLGAGGDITQAAERIKSSGILNPPKPAAEPASQPAETSAPVQSQPTETEKRRNERGQFVKAEPQTEIEGAEAEAPEPKATESSEGESDQEELADTLDGLATQLGMESSDLLDHLKATVKVSGEEKRATLRDLISSYQKGEDYTRKTQALAEQRRAFDAEAATYQQQREALSSQLQPLVQEMERVIGIDDTRLQQLLNDGDILEYERLKYQADQRKTQLNAAKHEQHRLAQEQQREAHNARVRDVEHHEELLFEQKPEWKKDINKARTELTNIRQYLKDNGYPGEEADQLYNSTGLLMAEKAMKWDALQRLKPDQLNKVKQAPKFQKPGVTKPAEDPKKNVHRANLNRLRKSGNWKDAAQALKSGGFLNGG